MRGGSGLGWLRGTALDLVERKRLDGPHKDGKITRPRACVAEVLHPFQICSRSGWSSNQVSVLPVIGDSGVVLGYHVKKAISFLA